MKKLAIKRWMLTASAVMILSNATGCSLKKNKCQGNHLNLGVVCESKSYVGGYEYYDEKSFTRMIRENFFGNHKLITNERFVEEHGHATYMEFRPIFNKVQKRAKKEWKNDERALEALDEIYHNHSILDFLDYIIASEGKRRGKYFSNENEDHEKIVDMFLSNLRRSPYNGMYMLKSGTFNFDEGCEFKLMRDYPDGCHLSECIIETVKNENFACDKVEEIKSVKRRYIKENYNVSQTYKIQFYGEEKITLNLSNDWEIINKKEIAEENCPCQNYSGTLSLKYKNEIIEAPVTEEKYEEIAETIATAVNNNKTMDEFLKDNNAILEGVFGDDYKNLEICENKTLIKKLK